MRNLKINSSSNIMITENSSMSSTNTEPKLFFQFDDESIVEIAQYKGNKFTIEIPINGNIEFVNGDKKFKLFVR